MFYQTSMGLIYLIFNQLPFLWDTSELIIMFNFNMVYYDVNSCYFRK